MTPEKALGFVNKLEALRFFARDVGPEARAELASRINTWCVGAPGFKPEAQAQWLIEKMLDDFDEWPGPLAMREAFRSRWPIPPQRQGSAGEKTPQNNA